MATLRPERRASVVEGPNLNALGVREQSNHEGALIEAIQEVLNRGGDLSAYSSALRRLAERRAVDDA